MNIKDKDIFIVIGASRTGKGTLLSAMMGQTMKFMKAKSSNIE
jgi:ABC-type branched-subunit amino acid transport system ATPase component